MFRRLQHQATPELAFANAIMSAGVVHTVARNCSRGDIEGCGCFRQSNGAVELDHYNQDFGEEGESTDWSWGGCSDNIEFGQLIAKRVLDKPEEQGTDLHAHAHLQNNLVGRTVSSDMVDYNKLTKVVITDSQNE